VGLAVTIAMILLLVALAVSVGLAAMLLAEWLIGD
jgi:hypothetical protein